MLPTQKEYFEKVIKPQLVKMATNGTLPLDMNQLTFSDFEDATNTYNNETKSVRERNERITKLGCFIADDDLDDALTRLENASYKDRIGDIVTMADQFEDMGYMKVDTFFKDYL